VLRNSTGNPTVGAPRTLGYGLIKTPARSRTRRAFHLYCDGDALLSNTGLKYVEIVKGKRLPFIIQDISKLQMHPIAAAA